MSTSSSVRAARRSPSSVSLGGHERAPYAHALLRHRRLGRARTTSSSCTLHERKGAEGVELVATFYAPGTVEQVARTIQGFGRGEAVVGIDAPSGRRLDLLGPDAPARAALGLPDGRYERMRVCDALLFRRGLPLYPVPAADEAAPEWMCVGFELFDGAGAARRATCRRAPTARSRARSGSSALRSGRVFETYPDAIFCALLGHRPSPKRTPWGGQQRIAALKLKGVVDEDGGLWHRTLDELDACAAAYAAYALSVGLGTWVGDPEEGVIVLPTADLLAALRQAAAAGALRARLIRRPTMECGWHRTSTTARRRAGRGSAPTASASRRRATTCPSSRSCCAPPASPSVGEIVQHREQPASRTSTSAPGKVDELKPLLKAADANLVAVDDELTPRQERNLEEALGMPVIDRTAVILDIFAGHAHTAEGKLQVELAQLEYNMARMRGLWTHLERLGAGRGVGGIGTRGPGESQIETDRRLARDRISALRRRLEDVKSDRAVMRAERERAHLPNVALAGYTNAGKSTLLNALTGAEVGVRDRLFHTLDPTTRTLRLEGRTYLVTDTVGFIRKLPHQLVDAFAATLEETKLADLILHVVDAHAPEEELEQMTRAVDDVLEEIGAGDSPRLLVLNKADLLDEDRRHELAFRHPEGLLVSAVTGEGIEELGARDRRRRSSAR